ncbi:hypothetical protein M8818_006667 [Zalaria obscura]|uniref:Uncharacterized protein n=1 Tax=Zalaria obscura TaxID=2024903 RepID=A0ACC3S5N3_9PEZI
MICQDRYSSNLKCAVPAPILLLESASLQSDVAAIPEDRWREAREAETWLALPRPGSLQAQMSRSRSRRSNGEVTHSAIGDTSVRGASARSGDGTWDQRRH